MNFMGKNYGSCGCPTAQPTFEQCKQVVQTCNVEEVPHYINYHTHVVNNIVKKHVNIPTYSVSEENILIEYPPAQAMPYQAIGGCGATYQQPMYATQMMGMGPTSQYQGNVGTEPIMQQPMQTPMYGMPGYPGMTMPFGY